MAVALKTKNFQSPSDLAKYCVTGGNNVTTIVSITFNSASGTYTLFYT
jgi:hypothetical protein